MAKGVKVYKGIDVSVHNENIDWDKVKNDGIDFVIIKCFYHFSGSMGEAGNFKKNINGAIAAGIKYIGVYAWSQAKNVAMAEDEARQTLAIINPYKEYITMPIYLDAEDSILEKTKDVKKVSQAFCKIIESAGYKAGIYSSASWYRTYLKDENDYTRWVAVYNGTDTPPSDVKRIDVWQYSSTGKVNGISGNVDMNYLYNEDILTINKKVDIKDKKVDIQNKKVDIEYYTEAELRQLMVDTFMFFKGAKKGSDKHHIIIDKYNEQKPLPVGYKLTYSDDWCAGTVTAIGMMCGLQDIVYGECSCTRMINLYKAKNRWIENEANKDAYKVGNFIIYDWDDASNYFKTDNKNSPEHVGMIYEVHDDYVMVIEGNTGSPSQVGTRKVAKNGRYIRGICAPDYASMAGKIVKNKEVSKPVKEEKSTSITNIKLEIDGSWGKATTSACQKVFKTTIDGIISNQPNDNKKYLSGCSIDSWEFKKTGYKGGSDLIKAIEVFIGKEGYYVGDVDGWCGYGLVTGIQRFLKNKGLYTSKIDGDMGKNTVMGWQKYINSQM